MKVNTKKGRGKKGTGEPRGSIVREGKLCVEEKAESDERADKVKSKYPEKLLY